MARSVEYSKIDKQGRIVIPSRIRRLAGIEGETEVLVRVEGGKIIIEPISRDLEVKVKEWVEEVLSSKPEPLLEESEESWKWVNKEYAERKLGLLP